MSLPHTGDGQQDLEAFNASFWSLLQENPSLLEDTRAVLFLSLPSCSLREVADAAACAHFSRSVVVQHVIANSWGRCFNDAFLFALASDRARYWLHVDEEHVCTRPFWDGARFVFKAPGHHLWQLQLSPDTEEVAPERQYARDGFREILARVPTPEEDVGEDDAWPCFYLKPSIFNIDRFRDAVDAQSLTAKPFDEDTGDWSTLEWRFGKFMEQVGAKKGVLSPAALASWNDDESMV